MKRLALIGESLVPMVVPPTFNQCSPLNSKLISVFVTPCAAIVLWTALWQKLAFLLGEEF